MKSKISTYLKLQSRPVTSLWIHSASAKKFQFT